MASQALGQSSVLTASSRPLVVISILNWNGWEDTLECLESVRRLDYPNFLTVVVDNGSWNGSADKIKAWAEANLGPGHVIADYNRETALAGGDPETEQALGRAPSAGRMVLIRNEENLGWTGGNNVSIHYALTRKGSGGYIFLLNNDALVDPQCVSSLVRVSQRAEAGIVGAVTVDRGSHHAGPAIALSFVRCLFTPLISPATPYQGKEEFWRSGFVSGAGMLIRRDVLETFHRSNAEYLFTRLFMYWDDQAFCYVANKLHYTTVFARKAIIYHRDATSSGGAFSPLLFYYRERGKILAANMALSPGWRTLFHILNPPLALARIIKYLCLQPGLARAAFCGVLDGYRGIGGKWRDHDREARRRFTCEG